MRLRELDEAMSPDWILPFMRSLSAGSQRF
jgi:hypothetical protein